MEPAAARGTLCKHCGEEFGSKGTYQTHYRRVHQREARIQSKDAGDVTISRSEEEKFECICGNGYRVVQSLIRHQKNCQRWKSAQEEMERVEGRNLDEKGLICRRRSWRF